MKKSITSLCLIATMGIAASFAIGQAQQEKFDLVALEGNVLPDKYVPITPLVEGKIDSIHVEEGQKVKADTILANLDKDLQEITVERARLAAQSQAKLNKAKLVAEEYGNIYENSKQALDQNAARKWEVRQKKLRYDQAKFQVKEAQDAIDIAQKDLKLEEEKLQRYNIRAPFDGRILRVAVKKGQAVDPKKELFIIYAIDQLKAEINLPGKLFGKLKEGQTYLLAPTDKMNDANGKPLPKRIPAVLKTADRLLDGGSFTYRCVFIIQNKEENLPAGFSIRLIWPQPNN